MILTEVMWKSPNHQCSGVDKKYTLSSVGIKREHNPMNADAASDSIEGWMIAQNKII